MTRLSSMSRIDVDIAALAAAVAPSEHRTITEQINYWARVGMQVERSASVGRRRVLPVAAGRAQFSELASDERPAAHALIDAGIAERAASERFGSAARAAGQTTVSIDDDGNPVETSAVPKPE